MWGMKKKVKLKELTGIYFYMIWMFSLEKII